MLSDPSSLHAAGACAGRQASLWASAQGCLLSLAALGQLRRALSDAAQAQRSAETSEQRLSEAVQEAHQREQAWRDATLALGQTCELAAVPARASAASVALHSLAHTETLLLKAQQDSEQTDQAAAGGGGGVAGAGASGGGVAAAAEALEKCLSACEVSEARASDGTEEALLQWCEVNGKDVTATAAVASSSPTAVVASESVSRLAAALPSLHSMGRAWLGRASSALAASAVERQWGRERLAQELAWLREAAAALQAQEAHAERFASAQAALNEAWDALKVVKLKVVRARGEIHIKEEVGDVVTSEERSLLQRLEVDSAAASRTVELNLVALRELPLPEAAALLASHPAAIQAVSASLSLLRFSSSRYF